jgi:hypothetical protein
MIDFLPESAEVLGGEEGEACRLTQHEMVVERGDRLQQAVDGLDTFVWIRIRNSFTDSDPYGATFQRYKEMQRKS